MQTTGSYYFWKWADNDLPGRPAEVHAVLLRGELPPALQTFDARPLVEQLERAAAQGCRKGEEWHWEIVPADRREQTKFVFVTCPTLDESEARIRRFIHAFSKLGLSGCDERKGWVIQGLSPKLNCFLTGQVPDDRAYDITADDLPYLLRRIDPKGDDRFGILEDRQAGRFVQCHVHGRRFCVEWAENEWTGATTLFDQWRAQDARRLAALGGTYGGEDLPSGRDPDLLAYADTLRIFQAFQRGEQRPARCPWRNINHLLG